MLCWWDQDAPLWYDTNCRVSPTKGHCSVKYLKYLLLLRSGPLSCRCWNLSGLSYICHQHNLLDTEGPLWLSFRENIGSPCYLWAVLQSRLADTWRAEALLPQTAGQKGRLVWGSWPLQMAVFLFMSECQGYMAYFSMEFQSFLDLLGPIPQSNLEFQTIHIVHVWICIQIWPKKACIWTALKSQIRGNSLKEKPCSKYSREGTWCPICGILYTLILPILKHRITFNQVNS